MNMKARSPLLKHGLAVAVIVVAAALRIWPLQALGLRAPWLTFYPAVMVAALYGGLYAGLLATLLSCVAIALCWPVLVDAPFLRDNGDLLGMFVFCVNCAMIAGIAEAMTRAQKQAKLALAKAEAANKAKSVFLANMSHELRTPLNAILGFSSLMRKEAGASLKQRATLDIINRSGEHLLTLINDVLDMARIEAGNIAMENAPFDLGEMVRETMDMMRDRAEEKGLELLLHPSSKFAGFICADAVKLRKVLINLIGNAVKFSPHGKITLRLDTRPADASQRLLLMIEVEDTGIGISAEDQAHVFDPFFQADNLIAQKGTGLGLTITRKDVELMDGRITVESTPGKGTTFRVKIPVGRVEESEISAVPKSRGLVIGLAPGQPEHRILIVEDQMENWLLLRQLLEDVGFTVRVAGSGAEGIDIFKSWRPHFIMMDIRMPVMDGLEATRRIRALEGGADVKIAAITASVFKEERDNVIAAGMDDFIGKPYRAKEIFACLTRHLGVRFLEEEVLAAPAPESVGALRPEAVAALPEALRRELTDILTGLDPDRIAEIIRRISEGSPALGNALSYHADRFNYTAILRALQAGGDTPITETT